MLVRRPHRELGKLVMLGKSRSVGEQSRVLAAGGGELDAGAVRIWQGDYRCCCETQRCGVAENFGAGLGMVFVSFEFADGGAGQDQKIEGIEQGVDAAAEFGVAGTLVSDFSGGKRCTPSQAFVEGRRKGRIGSAGGAFMNGRGFAGLDRGVNGKRVVPVACVESFDCSAGSDEQLF